MSGYIKLHRSICENPMWESEPFTKSQAWVDLLLNANYVERKIIIRGQTLTVQRGQIAWSEVTMSARWKWSRNKVRRFLKALSDEGMIVQQAEHLTSLVTICNYEEYQGRDTADETTSETPDDTADETSDGTQHKKGKKVKKEKKGTRAPEKPIPSDFQITEQMREWAKAQNFTHDVDASTTKWINAMTASNRTYIDWVAAWRNGMLKAQEWMDERMAKQSAGSVVPFNAPRPRKMLPKVGSA